MRAWLLSADYRRHASPHADFPAALDDGDEAVLADTGYAAFFAMRYYYKVILIKAEVSDVAICLFGYFNAIFVIGI